MRRWLGLVVVALVTATCTTLIPAAPASAVPKTGTDPQHDNAPGLDARGDLTSYSVDYHVNGITVALRTRTFENPQSAANWVAEYEPGVFTQALWVIDVNGDDADEYGVVYFNDGLGNVIASVQNTQGDELCEATTTWSSTLREYSATFHASCIGTPAQVRVAAGMLYETPTTESWDVATTWTPFAAIPSAPAAPTNVSAVAGHQSATVSWTAPPDSGSPLGGYTITVSPGGNSYSALAGETSHVITGLTNGVSYTFTVQAWNGIGLGPASAPSNAVVPAPTAPAAPVLVATRGDQQGSLIWNAPEANGSAITGYTVTVSPGGISIPIAASTTNTVVPGLTNGVAYSATVTATNGIGTSSASNTAVFTPAGLPSVPTNAVASGGPGVATVSWAASNANGAALTKYTVTASPGGAQTVVAGNKTSATVNLPNGGTFTFTVTATNAVGTSASSAPSAGVFVVQYVPKSGYWMLGRDGAVYGFGNAANYGRASFPAGVRATAIVNRSDGLGYWVVASDGSVRAFGNAQHFGDHPPLGGGEFVSTMSVTPTHKGYWLFTNRGRVIRYGDAKFYGDMSGVALNGPVVASVATPTGKGYYMVGSDGGVFSFGDARFKGSTGGLRLNRPVVGISPTPDNKGYWLVASDGGVFAFSATFRGSMGSVRLNRPVNGLVPFGNGYLMVASDGGVFNFSNKPFYGSLASSPPASPIIGISAFSK
jgi:hypothetical protein